MKSSKGAYRVMADLIAVSKMIGKFIVKKSDIKFTKQSSRTIQRLIDVDYLKLLDKDKLLITDRGKINMLNELVKRRKSDGKKRIIIFDIPEKMKVKRNAFRRHLIDLGFKMEQQSAWLSNLPCEDLVTLVIKHHKLQKFTSLIVGKLIH